MDEMMRRNENPTMAEVSEGTKEIAEIQAKMILARQFPRDINNCRKLIAAECQNIKLAEHAAYEFPRGNSVVRGASIRLVEMISRYYGNFIAGIKELSQTNKKATVRAYAWDLESNFADEKVFDVEYIRSTQKGTYSITDPRDKYEMMANMAARRKRACMQAIIPQYLIDEAMEICQKTLEKSIVGEKKNLPEIRTKMLEQFQVLAEWITEDDFKTVCGKDFDKLNEKDIVKLRSLYNAIKDGFVKPEVAFKKETTPEEPSMEEKQSLDQLNADLTAEWNPEAENGTDKG